MSSLPALETDNTHEEKEASTASSDTTVATSGAGDGVAPTTAAGSSSSATKKDGNVTAASAVTTPATAGTEGGTNAETASAAAATPTGAAAADATDAEIEAMKKRVKEMEEEAKKIEDMQNNVEKSLKPKPATVVASGPDVDARSVYVGNVDYSTTPEELKEFFSSCGIVNRITILCDKYTGHPKGYAYVEFKDADAVANAMLLNDSEFKGRPLKVSQKRTNLPGMSEYRGRAPGGGGRVRRPRGPPPFIHGSRGFAAYAYAPAPRPRFRHRRFFSPYAR